ncbi:hypothetical protein S83_056723 [Arachis hypogaea]
MGDPLITIIFHHGGSFITEADRSMSYNGGETCELPDIDTDTLDVFFVRDYHKKIGYNKVSQSWWLVPNRPMQTGLRAIADDNELMEMCYLAQQNKGLFMCTTNMEYLSLCILRKQNQWFLARS